MDEKRLLEIYKRYAKTKGYRLNPDQDAINMLIEGQLNNEMKYGYRYCTCKVRTGDEVRDAKIICPCATHTEEIEEMGRCWCGLFLKA
ncbi:MAG: ferredoxin-thioredoxin reductase catalytic domain-containing protein [Candidatus Bathyarchaeia archaeon]